MSEKVNGNKASKSQKEQEKVNKEKTEKELMSQEIDMLKKELASVKKNQSSAKNNESFRTQCSCRKNIHSKYFDEPFLSAIERKIFAIFCK